MTETGIDADIDRELAQQLAERAQRYRIFEDDELEADDVDDQLGGLLGELVNSDLASSAGPFDDGEEGRRRRRQWKPRQEKGWFSTARTAVHKIHRSVSVELEREGVISESSSGALRRQNIEAEQLRSRKWAQRNRSLQPQRPQPQPQMASEAKADDDGPKAPPYKVDAAEERVCRMCLGEEGEADDNGLNLGPLIAPCSCAGSMKWVHAQCLYRWRTTSTSPSSANICGQCSFRYRLKPPRGGSVMIWALNCHPLRVILAIAGVAVGALLAGVLSIHTVRAIGTIPPLQKALLYTLSDPPPPYRISLADDKAAIHIQHFLFDDFFGNRAYRLCPTQVDILARASIDAINFVQETKRDDPVYYDLSAVDDGWPETKVHGGKNESMEINDDRIVQPLALRSYTVISSNIKKIWREAHLARRGWRVGTVGDAVGGSGNSSGTDAGESNEKSRKPMPSELWRLIQQATIVADASSSDLVVRSGAAARGMREVTIQHSFARFQERHGNPSQSVAVRYPPGFLGIVRLVLHAFYEYWHENIEALRKSFGRMFIGLARASVAVTLVIASRRGAIELVWLLVKVATSAAIAYLEEELQAPMPLPKILPGAPIPIRSQRRIWAGRALFVLIHASVAVFGPFWPNWWGGYPVSIYMRPAASSWSLMESFLFMKGRPGLAIVQFIDYLVSLLEGSSAAARWFRQTYTNGWLGADWTFPDASAGEGYRRVLAGLLGDERRAAMSRFDIYLSQRGRRLITGRVRPGDMAALVDASRSSWDAYVRLAIMLGALVFVTASVTLLLQIVVKVVVLNVFLERIRPNLQHLAAIMFDHEWLRTVGALFTTAHWQRWKQRRHLRRQGAEQRQQGSGVRARLNPMLDTATLPPPDPLPDPAVVVGLGPAPAPAQAPAPAVGRGAPAQHPANIELNIGGVAIGLAAGMQDPDAGMAVQGDPPRSRWTMVVPIIMNIYSNVMFTVYLLNVTAHAAPFAPFAIMYNYVRGLEKTSRVARDVIDLSSRA
ncbi:hypothetical protein K437DRAFT_273247 [Tilletiaria anomala UBC 951]|uniref:RING-CH-type domain-containing protein n=1 Tax=Tilletiaria anomala (strain ATCC 24038 / CBS 436.72 / UBC 951) TaxID=1037660 RepID=A0A066W6J0_TILAU|nr:uncharacterized protein K437DRAFT_273247 [Tilletiaria anomala UBC 951]KDN49597.1 hypothetical protein K437DRAFT_273247 [Tilletiaria anomala UBC 951]